MPAQRTSSSTYRRARKPDDDYQSSRPAPTHQQLQPPAYPQLSSYIHQHDPPANLQQLLAPTHQQTLPPTHQQSTDVQIQLPTNQQVPPPTHPSFLTPTGPTSTSTTHPLAPEPSSATVNPTSARYKWSPDSIGPSEPLFNPLQNYMIIKGKRVPMADLVLKYKDSLPPQKSTQASTSETSGSTPSHPPAPKPKSRKLPKLKHSVATRRPWVGTGDAPSTSGSDSQPNPPTEPGEISTSDVRARRSERLDPTRYMTRYMTDEERRTARGYSSKAIMASMKEFVPPVPAPVKRGTRSRASTLATRAPKTGEAVVEHSIPQTPSAVSSSMPTHSRRPTSRTRSPSPAPDSPQDRH